MTRPDRPPLAGATLVFDGDCGFCTTWAERVRDTWRRPPAIAAWQLTDLDALGLDPVRAAEAVWFVRGGIRASGHAAIAQLLRAQPGFGARLLGSLLITPPFSLAARLGYRLVARFRHRLPGGTPACAMAARGTDPVARAEAERDKAEGDEAERNA